MLVMPRFSGSAVALIAALASYRPMPDAPTLGQRRPSPRRAERASGERTPFASAAEHPTVRPDRRR